MFKDLLDSLQKQHSEKDAEIKQYVDKANELTESKRDSNRIVKKMKADLRLGQVFRHSIIDMIYDVIFDIIPYKCI